MRKWLAIATAALILAGLLLALALSTRKPAPVTFNFLSAAQEGNALVAEFAISNSAGRVFSPKSMEKWNGNGWVLVKMPLENWFQTASPELFHCRFGTVPAGHYRFAVYTERYVKGWRSLGVRVHLWLQDKRTSLNPFDQITFEQGNPEVMETEFSVP